MADRTSRCSRVALWWLFAAMTLTGCYPEQDPSSQAAVSDTGGGGEIGMGGPGVGGASAGSGSKAHGGRDPSAAGNASDGNLGGAPSDRSAPVVCIKALGEPIPARSEIVSASAAPPAKAVFTSDIYGQFHSICGGCHSEASPGGFMGQSVTLQNFAKVVDQQAVDAIFATNPTQTMPPVGNGGKLAKDRPPNDPVLNLAALLKSWIAAGRPADVFYEKAEVAPGTSPYLMSPALGAELSNLGNCIADKASVGTDVTKTKKLDDYFASATNLPLSLEDTDMVSFDSAVLAPYGVIPYAPAYPLWSDDAKKMRFVRVPRGQSIAFDKASQTFKIPSNTRFYKTFLKQVTDQSGNLAYKRIETRLIVSRPDACDKSGACTPRALMGTYVWNDQETEALLLTDTLRNGQPFADHMITYVTDEQKAQGVNDPQAAGLTRSYAVPGSTRCVQCHMGSVNGSFILGMEPLQIRRRHRGEGGVIEETTTDELNQLQRLIDYGVITGIDSIDDVVKLEDSQAVLPRNNYELIAQGYMLGNCGHCHNPRGFPSVQNPELTDLLRFWPDMHGGIFQFPLERVSPRIRRGANNSVSLPYITPSLFDLAVQEDTAIPGTDIIQYTDKRTIVVPPVGSQIEDLILAPWRSVIYRNVDTPFTYSEDYAIFPHMPFNTPGFDCRLPRILGDWMVSIPAQRKQNVPDAPGDPGVQKTQPYVEITPSFGDAYYKAVKDANTRLDAYHDGHRYNFCPNTSDIVDPDVVSGSALVPQDTGYPNTYFPIFLEKDGVPDRPHWAVTDPTEVPGPWTPRRSDWTSFIVSPTSQTLTELQKVDPDKAEVLSVLTTAPNLRVTDELRAFALDDGFPMTLWSVDGKGQKCDAALQGEHQAAYFTGNHRLRWMADRTDQAKIYTTSPGAAVFTQICRNCHGPLANGHSSLADTLLNLTGGVSRVADLSGGLFGSECQKTPGANCAAGSYRQSVFSGAAAELGLQADDVAGRYLAWMALGGTQKPIPDAVLLQVGNQPAFGELRHGIPPEPSANMLAAARQHCRDLLATGIVRYSTSHGTPIAKIGLIDPSARTNQGLTDLIYTNGDGEMWEQLCAFKNPAPVFALELLPDSVRPTDYAALKSNYFYRRSSYPSTAPVGNINVERVTNGITDDNSFPWCVVIDPDSTQGLAKDATDVTKDSAVVAFAASHSVNGQPMPICPKSLLTPANKLSEATLVKDWSIRGAANAGLAVFAYIDALAQGKVTPKVLYNECDKLNASGL